MLALFCFQVVLTNNNESSAKEKKNTFFSIADKQKKCESVKKAEKIS